MSSSIGELLKRTAADSFGFFPAYPGLLLKRDRYKVIRLLGLGQFSSTVLVADLQSRPTRYLAVKILTAYGTSLNHAGHLNELGILEAVSRVDRNDSLPFLIDHFEELGPHGRHLCFVVPPLTTDLGSFRRSAPKKRLPLHTVKITLLCVLIAVEKLHRINIIHTDIKPDNIMFDVGEDKDSTERELAADPPKVDGQVELNGTTYPVMLPQPLAHDYKWNDTPMFVDRYDLVLNDLGQARLASDPQTYDLGTAFALRAPEVILRAGYGTKIDIWAIGCLTFELLTGLWAFHPESGADFELEDDHLARMLELTGERFSQAMLARAELSQKYFDGDGNLLRIKQLVPVGIEATLKDVSSLADYDIPPAAEFIRACLCLDPDDRPSAEQLLRHQWMKGAEVCLDYRPPTAVVVLHGVEAKGAHHRLSTTRQPSNLFRPTHPRPPTPSSTVHVLPSTFRYISSHSISISPASSSVSQRPLDPQCGDFAKIASRSAVFTEHGQRGAVGDTIMAPRVPAAAAATSMVPSARVAVPRQPFPPHRRSLGIALINISMSSISTSVYAFSRYGKPSTRRYCLRAATRERTEQVAQTWEDISTRRDAAPNVKITSGVWWELAELQWQVHPNPAWDTFGEPPVRKQRVC
ncbi:hypothetical protein EW146_g10 [Bondarzewia mesenterica]|uniref:non-specific serine/threonine protein kinase n=1 Tax=Bondarzewia mesenterica TaxID=1095465 RepID=A0A4S4M878_9AGAM|nr:hypothetical protein EW146_g10 [Bondarzewia mesenterica]